MSAKRFRHAGLIGAEIVAAVAAATGAVAALQGGTPARGLGLIYLLSVLGIAIRRGEAPALGTALLGVLTHDFFFIAPRHRLEIAHSQDVVELVVLLIAAVVVGRLASHARQRTEEADTRAHLATAREREATLLAEAASTILAGPSLDSQLILLGRRIATATEASSARIALEPAPASIDGQIAIRLGARERPTWMYVSDDLAWDRSDLERVAEPLGRLIDVAHERERVARAAADAETSLRADAARTAILHAISHDLRSPLTAITTAAAALKSAGVTKAEQADLIGSIEAEGERLARLVADLLDLSKIQAGAVSPVPDWCDLHDAVASAAAHVGGEHPIDLVLPVDLPLVRADAAQLERVFSNLLENAVKHSPPGSPVKVSAGAGAGVVTVRVIDHGRGIPRAERARVFEPFFRGRGGAGAGSGLGLAICRGFVEANGGRIVLQSEAELGTSFAVSFPIVPQPTEVAS